MGWASFGCGGRRASGWFLRTDGGTRLNFFLIGAPKSGTTLHGGCLGTSVYLSPLKEATTSRRTSTLSGSVLLLANTPADLAGYLADRPQPRQIGFVQSPTTTPDCLKPLDWNMGWSENAVRLTSGRARRPRAWRNLAGARILAVLRNPVERLHSHWLMARKYGFTADLLEAVERDLVHPARLGPQSCSWRPACMPRACAGGWTSSHPGRLRCCSMRT